MAYLRRELQPLQHCFGHIVKAASLPPRATTATLFSSLSVDKGTAGKQKAIAGGGGHGSVMSELIYEVTVQVGGVGQMVVAATCIQHVAEDGWSPHTDSTGESDGGGVRDWFSNDGDDVEMHTVVHKSSSVSQAITKAIEAHWQAASRLTDYCRRHRRSLALHGQVVQCSSSSVGAADKKGSASASASGSSNTGISGSGWVWVIEDVADAELQIFLPPAERYAVLMALNEADPSLPTFLHVPVLSYMMPFVFPTIAEAYYSTADQFLPLPTTLARHWLPKNNLEHPTLVWKPRVANHAQSRALGASSSKTRRDRHEQQQHPQEPMAEKVPRYWNGIPLSALAFTMIF